MLLPVIGVAADSPIDFDHEIVPILREHCVECHGGEEAKGGFSVNTRELFLDGEAAVPGKPEESHFLTLIRSADADEQMPPSSKPRVTVDQQTTLSNWVKQGMPWTNGFSFAGPSYQAPLLPRTVELPGPAHLHPIDQWLAAQPSVRSGQTVDPIDDVTFIRRASMDLIGVLPSIGEVDAFVSDRSPDKHAKLIDTLLADKTRYAEHWLTFWNDWLRNDYDGTGFITGGRKQVTKWLYQSLIDNKPYDRFAHELIAPPTAESRGFIDGIKWRGEVSAGQTIEIQFAQSVAQSFLGINLKCASCHDSFIDRWTLGEAYSLAAVYSAKPLAIHRCDKPTGETAEAAWLFPELGQIDPAAPREQRLEQLASLVTHKNNGRFARTIVNRLWAQLMGQGIVHPLDAMHAEPAHEDLLDYLANQLVENEYDLKSVLRLIATSNAYRSSSDSAPTERLAETTGMPTVPFPKRLTAEQFVDALWQVTDAAPTSFDAPIVRGTDAADTAGVGELHGQWIWGESARDGKVPPGGEQLVFRKQLDLPAAIDRGALAVTADNGFEMYIGRRQVASSDEWTRVQTVRLAPLLKQGTNEILIVARNFLDRPNLAGLYVEGRLRLTDGSEIEIVSDDSWSVSIAQPTGGREGRVGKVTGPWTTAVSLGRPEVYSSIMGPTRANLALAIHGIDQPVRASLLKSDALMRALGRPNRDQIVSSRPGDLTTLEAITLANGQSIAKILSDGAQHWGGQPLTTSELATQMFRTALTRGPTPSEQQLLVEMLGAEPSAESIEDVLWAICMMPEFLMIR